MIRSVFSAITIITLALLAWPVGHADAQYDERILSYNCEIEILEDTSMIVEETITVRAMGFDIRRGIFRDFPTRYGDTFGPTYDVGFELLEVTRDGVPEPHHIEHMRNGKRIYLGDEDVYLDQGEYTYTIKYKTNRQLGFFENYDELYWNATGTDWDFPIDYATATVTLPADVGENNFMLKAFTGYQGDVEKHYRTVALDNRSVYFETTDVLAPQQGLTIVVGFPKGIIEPAPQATQIRFWVGSHHAETLGIAGLVALLIYYFVTWVLMGIDPKRGIVTPEQDPPAGLSPAVLRYIANMGVDFTTFTAALTSMAVKGYLRIDVDSGGSHTISRFKTDENVLADEERELGRALFQEQDAVLIDQDNHATLSNARYALQRSLSNRFQAGYFSRNVSITTFGVIASVVLLIIMGTIYSGDKTVYFVCTFMASIGATFFFMGLISLLPGQSSIAAAAAVESSARPSLFLVLFMVPFVLIPLGVLYFFGSPWLPPIILGFAMIHALFIPLIPKYTKHGRELLDRIEGHRLALMGRGAGLPGGDATDALGFLPYAIALNVQRQWAAQLETMFRTTERPPMPVWYNNPHDRHFRHERLANDLASSFTHTIASASTAPSSSSSGGFSGGSSGGGGGGGGGGGW